MPVCWVQRSHRSQGSALTLYMKALQGRWATDLSYANVGKRSTHVHTQRGRWGYTHTQRGWRGYTHTHTQRGPVGLHTHTHTHTKEAGGATHTHKGGGGATHTHVHTQRGPVGLHTHVRTHRCSGGLLYSWGRVVAAWTRSQRCTLHSPESWWSRSTNCDTALAIDTIG